MKIFLTGSSGFLGSNFLLRAPKNWTVVCFDLKKPETVVLKLAKCRTKVIVGNISSKKAVEKAMKGCDIAVHLAGIVGPKECSGNVSKTVLANIVGTLNVVESAKKHGLKKIVFASTYFVYGFEKSSKPPFSENSPLMAGEIYSASKLVGEKIAESFGNFAILRFASIYGKGHGFVNCGGIINGFVEACLKNEPLKIFGNGSQKIDYVHVFDACNALFHAVNSVEKKFVLNAGGGKGLSVNEIGEIVSKNFFKKFGKKPAILHISGSAEVFADKWLDIGKIRSRIRGYPEKSLNEGISEMLEFLSGKK